MGWSLLWMMNSFLDYIMVDFWCRSKVYPLQKKKDNHILLCWNFIILVTVPFWCQIGSYNLLSSYMIVSHLLLFVKLALLAVSRYLLLPLITFSPSGQPIKNNMHFTDRKELRLFEKRWSQSWHYSLWRNFHKCFPVTFRIRTSLLLQWNERLGLINLGELHRQYCIVFQCVSFSYEQYDGCDSLWYCYGITYDSMFWKEAVDRPSVRV